VALLILRLSLSAFLLIRSPECCPAVLFHLTSIAVATLLTLGLLTPYVAIFGAVAGGTCVVIDAVRLEADLWLVFAMLFAVALLGAGAFSLDALIYGRRRVVLPPK
jgi:hypothetical protein